MNDFYLFLLCERPLNLVFVNFLVKFEALADADIVHHILLYGCPGDADDKRQDIWLVLINFIIIVYSRRVVY